MFSFGDHPLKNSFLDFRRVKTVGRDLIETSHISHYFFQADEEWNTLSGVLCGTCSDQEDRWVLCTPERGLAGPRFVLPFLIVILFWGAGGAEQVLICYKAHNSESHN